MRWLGSVPAFLLGVRRSLSSCLSMPKPLFLLGVCRSLSVGATPPSSTPVCHHPPIAGNHEIEPQGDGVTGANATAYYHRYASALRGMSTTSPHNLYWCGAWKKGRGDAGAGRGGPWL